MNTQIPAMDTVVDGPRDAYLDFVLGREKDVKTFDISVNDPGGKLKPLVLECRHGA